MESPYTDRTYIDNLERYSTYVEFEECQVNWKNILLYTLVENLGLKVNATLPIYTNDISAVCLLASSQLSMLKISITTNRNTTNATNPGYLYGRICSEVLLRNNYCLRVSTYTNTLGWSDLSSVGFGNLPISLKQFNLLEISAYATKEWMKLNQDVIDKLTYLQILIKHQLMIHGVSERK